MAVGDWTPKIRARPPRAAAHPLRVGIVGAGLVSRLHLGALDRVPHAEVVGIADRDLVRGAAVASQRGLPMFGSLGELLDRARPDVVHVLTPPFTHAELCLEALAAGSHVYVEKPLACSVEDCTKIGEAVARSRRSLCVGHCLVHEPIVERAWQLLEGGAIGEPRHARALYCFDPARIPGVGPGHWYGRLSGGFLEDLAAHPLSLVTRLLGEPKGITVASTGPPQEELAALVEGETRSALVVVSIGTRPERVELEIRGTAGVIVADVSGLVLRVERERGLPRKVARGWANVEQSLQLVWQTASSAVRFAARRIDTTQGVESLVRAFYDSLAIGTPPPVGWQEGRSVVASLRRIWPLERGAEKTVEAEPALPAGRRIRPGPSRGEAIAARAMPEQGA